MAIRIEKYESRSAIHLIWGAIVLLFLVTAWLYRDLAPLLPSCLFHDLTGLPCLTCGATRSVISLSMFDIPSSFLYNPLLFLFTVGIVSFSFYHLLGLIFKKRIDLRLTNSGKKTVRIAVVAIIALNWAYLIAAGI